MERNKLMATEDRLSHLPDALLLHILSLLPDKKEVVRTSVLSKQWRCLWKSVPVSLHFSSDNCENDQDILDFVAATNRELNYLRSFRKIPTFKVVFGYGERYAKDVDLWVYFATQIARVEIFSLSLYNISNYELPKFVYKNTSLRNMILANCKLNPSGSINWSSLVFLSIGHLNLKEAVMGKILSGCPNLEHLELRTVWGIHHLDINSEKLRKMIIKDYITEGSHMENHRLLEISAPNIQDFQLLGFCHDIHLLLRNMASLITANLDFRKSVGQENLEEECRYFKELLHSVAHVENLELGPWCIQLLSLLELKGWQFPASTWKYLKLNACFEQLDFPGICRLLQSSSYLETMIIDWENHYPRQQLSRLINVNEDGRKLQKHIFNCSLLHLKTVKIINFHGPRSANKFVVPLVQYLLRNAEVLEKLIISVRLKGSDGCQEYIGMAQEILSFPRLSLRASVMFYYE